MIAPGHAGLGVLLALVLAARSASGKPGISHLEKGGGELLQRSAGAGFVADDGGGRSSPQGPAFFLPDQEAGMLVVEAGVMVLAVVLLAVLAEFWRRRAAGDCCISPLKYLGSIAVTLAACGAFIVIGPALMMLNKHIMDDLHFNYPISICGLGLLSSSVTSHAIVCLGFGEVRPEALQAAAGAAWVRVTLPIGLMKALTMATGNAAYLHLSFGFIQMLKAFTPLVVLAVMRIAGVRMPPRSAVWCVTAIVAGTMVEVKGELEATFVGLFLMFFSEMCEAVSIVLSQKLLQNQRLSVLEGMYITAPAGALFIVIGAVALESPKMVAAGHLQIPLDHPFQFIATAVLGVAINFISFLVIQVTSSLTMKILNTVRGVGLVYVGVVFYGEVHPWLQLVGYAVALVGFAGYNYFQLFPEAAQAVEQAVDRTGERLCGALTCGRGQGVPSEGAAEEAEDKGAASTSLG